MSDQIVIRKLTTADLPEVIPIEQRSFPTPWSMAMFVLELSKGSSVCLCAVEAGRIVGYLVTSRYASVWHVMNVSVDPEHRRRGFATKLLETLFEKADEQRTHYTLEVRISNHSAIEMYRRNGFKAAGIRPGYYADNREDALIMWRSTDPAFEPPNVSTSSEWALGR